VLIADDDASMRFVAHEALVPARIDLVEAKDGSEAVAAFGEHRPDLVLLDVSMPVLDGYSACREIRNRPEGQLLPILIVTGSDDPDSIQKAYDAGATDFVEKPVNWLILVKRLRYMFRASVAVDGLRRSEEKHRALLSAMPDMMIRVRNDGVCLDCKVPGDFVPDLQAHRILNRNVAELLPDELAERFMYEMRSVLADRQSLVSEYSIPLGGRVRDYEARLVANGSREVFAIVRDITRRKEIEEQLRQSQKMEALGSLAGGIAHDFNNALSVIMGYTELTLLGAENDPEHVRKMTAVLDAAKHASLLTRQLLAFSRKQGLRPTRVGLNDTLERLLSVLRRLLREDVELELDLEPDLWPVQADPIQLEQVLLNLIANAGDAMPNGGRLFIKTKSVKVKSDAEGSELRESVLLEVSDTGSGMDRATLERIFEPFYTTKKTGTGMGLATVYGIVKQSGGHIEVDSEPGKGTEFRIYFARSKEASVMVSAQGACQVGKPAGSETVLVVDDEESIRAMVTELLERKGYRALSAANADVALSVARVHSGPIDLLLTDVVMPGMSGRDLADVLARTQQALKVIYMSGHVEDTVREHGVSHAEIPFLQKPFTSAALYEKVGDVISTGINA
jgi:PAS domain S-box-containing protein